MVLGEESNLKSQLVAMQATLAECMEAGDVAGMGRAKAKIKKLELLILQEQDSVSIAKVEVSATTDVKDSDGKLTSSENEQYTISTLVPPTNGSFSATVSNLTPVTPVTPVVIRAKSKATNPDSSLVAQSSSQKRKQTKIAEATDFDVRADDTSEVDVDALFAEERRNSKARLERTTHHNLTVEDSESASQQSITSDVLQAIVPTQTEEESGTSFENSEQTEAVVVMEAVEGASPLADNSESNNQLDDEFTRHREENSSQLNSIAKLLIESLEQNGPETSSTELKTSYLSTDQLNALKEKFCSINSMSSNEQSLQIDVVVREILEEQESLIPDNRAESYENELFKQSMLSVVQELERLEEALSLESESTATETLENSTARESNQEHEQAARLSAEHKNNNQSAKKEISKFWKFLTKTEEFLAEENDSSNKENKDV